MSIDIILRRIHKNNLLIDSVYSYVSLSLNLNQYFARICKSAVILEEKKYLESTNFIHVVLEFRNLFIPKGPFLFESLYSKFANHPI